MYFAANLVFNATDFIANLLAGCWLVGWYGAFSVFVFLLVIVSYWKIFGIWRF